MASTSSSSSITYTVPGVPRLDQLSEVSNPRMDCVFTSNAALATAYTGRRYTGSQIKAMDNNYGPSYAGGASERNLVDTMLTLGISMTRVAHPTQQLLIDELHHHIPQGHACIVTMPSQWNSAVTNAGASWNPRTYSGPSHVGLMCGVGQGVLRCMNPWGGFWQDQSDAWWRARLLYGEIWVAIKVPVPVAAATKPTATTTTASAPMDYQSEAIRLWHEAQANRAEIAALKAKVASALQALSAA